MYTKSYTTETANIDMNRVINPVASQTCTASAYTLNIARETSQSGTVYS